MIKTCYIFDDIDAISYGWIADSKTDETDLAASVDFFSGRGIHTISVPAIAAGKIWPWVEKEHTKIFGRFNFGDGDSEIDELSKSVTSGFRSGLDGAQVFVPLSRIKDFVKEIYSIRDDLFFRRHFSIAMDIDGKSTPDWDTLFENLKKIRVDSVLLVAYSDVFNTKSDFVGRVFDMLNRWNMNCDLHIMFGQNMMRVSQVLRLVAKIKPELSNRLRVFRMING